LTSLLALAAGALVALSLPPFDIEWLGWFALAPLLIAVRGRRGLEAVGLGMLAGLACGAVQVGWYPNVPVLEFAYLPFLWLAMLLGVVAGMAAAARRRWSGLRWVLFVAGAGVAAEWLTAFSPLPLNLALCQYRTLHVIQIAALTGVWGVSFLVWWTNAALADAALSWGRSGKKTGAGQAQGPGYPPGAGQAQGPGQARGLPLRGPVGVALAALAVTLGYSHLVLTQGPGQALDLPLRVAAIQDSSAGEIAPFVRAASLDTGEVDREALTRGAAAKGAKLIVGSERCLGAAFAPDTPGDATAQLARELKAHLVVGYTEAASVKSFNCAAIVAPDGRVKGIHRKIHLFLGERQSTQCGCEAKAFDTGLGKVGVEICFDSCYTDVTRRIARAGARIIAMPNWDPPTPRGILHRLHAALVPFRAVENRVPFVRADANGLSQIIDATGRIISQAPLYASDAVIGDVTLGDGKGTTFTRLGDWLAYLCLFLVAIFALTGFRSQVAVKTTSSDAAASA
jgi:apolipoprotein N-acyltransferase